MIWKVDNSNTYLVGSIHALKAGMHPHSHLIDEIYSQSSHIIFEADMDNITLSLLTYGNGEKLSNNISHKLFAKAQKQWLKRGLPAAELEATKPWQVANRLIFALLEKRGFTFGNSVDKSLLARAKTDNKDISFLESAESSLLCFDNAPLREQIEYLSSVINNPDGVIDNFNKIYSAWAKDDIDSLSHILQENLRLLPVLFNSLIIKRNEAWLRAIVTCIESGSSCLIAVGALHLVDISSIQTKIRDLHGYSCSAIY